METRTVAIFEKDLPFLEKMRDKLRKKGLADVIHSMIELIKEQKSEEELK